MTDLKQLLAEDRPQGFCPFNDALCRPAETRRKDERDPASEHNGRPRRRALLQRARRSNETLRERRRGQELADARMC